MTNFYNELTSKKTVKDSNVELKKNTINTILAYSKSLKVVTRQNGEKIILDAN